MLENLTLKNFAITDQIDVEFQDGLTTITGETGAGKSILIDALTILLGGRAESNLIRHHQSQAEVQGYFTLPHDHAALGWLDKHDLADDNGCILRRTIRRDKPSRAWINGRSVPAFQLKQLGKLLVDIHGQHEHHSLLQKSTQREILDNLSGCQTNLNKLAPLYDQLIKNRQQLQSLEFDAETIRQRAQLLEHQLQELTVLNPKPNEWTTLESTHKKLGRMHEITETTNQIINRLDQYEDDSITSLLSKTQQQLEYLCQYDPTLKDVLTLLQEASINIEEVVIQLRENHLSEKTDEVEVEQIQSRFSLYHELSRKHNIGPENLTAYAQQLKLELDRLINPEAEKQALKSNITNLEQQCLSIAKVISQKRAICAKNFNQQVSTIIQKLGIKDGIFEVRLNKLSAQGLNRFGLESIEFYVATSAGYPSQPLDRIVSGGELARISLSIQVVAASATLVPTLIFDEIDVGIGGAVADTVGFQLQQLGKNKQIICITHLAQVATRGQQHLVVSKSTGQPTNVTVISLSGKQRIKEIARMTTGAKLTDKAIAHAEELLKVS